MAEVKARHPPGNGRNSTVRAFVLRFLLLFAALEAVVYLVLWREGWFAPYAAANARATAALLAPFLEGVQATGGLVRAPTFGIQVRPGCDAYQAGAVLLAGICAFPATRRQRLVGAGVGLLALQLLNLLRLAVLLRVGIESRTWFERLHVEILPVVFVAAALGLLFGWILWTGKRA